MGAMEQSAYLWNLTGDLAALAARLREGGCQALYVKAADGGDLWDHVTPGLLAPFIAEGLAIVPWMFNYGPRKPEIAACVAMAKQIPTGLVMLNPEVIAGGSWSQTSNDQAAAWVRQLRAALVAAFGTAPLIGFSSCPSWDGDKTRGAPWFPYEGFAAECDGPLMPQHYWHPDVVDQVDYSNRRTPPGKAVVPILAACTNWEPEKGIFWPTSAIVSQAADSIARCAGLAGLSAWRVDRDDYDAGAMASAYQLLSGEAARREVEAKHNIDPVLDARERLVQYFGTRVSAELQGTDAPSVRYHFNADFSRWDQPANAVGLHGEFVTIWTAPNDEAIRAVQPELFAEALADRLVERL